MSAAHALDDYWSAVGTNDSGRALAIARACLADGATITEVLEDLVVPAQRRVGEQWATGSWSVAREHAATAVSEHVVRSLDDHVRTDRSQAALIVACAEREWHSLSTLVLSTALADAGQHVVHLGGDVSTRVLQGALLDTPARAVLVSASLGSSLLHVRRHIETATASGVPAVVGGRAFDPARRRAAALGASAQADSVPTLLTLVPQLPGYVAPAVRLTHPGAEEAAQLAPRTGALARAVLARVGRAAGYDPAGDEPGDTLADQLPLVAGSLVGSLLTQDPSVLDDTLGWLELVLEARTGYGDLLEEVRAALAVEVRDFPEAAALVVGSALHRPGQSRPPVPRQTSPRSSPSPGQPPHESGAPTP